MFVFLIAQVLGQCLVRQDIDTQFFTLSKETIYIPLMDYFIGQNLTFSSDDAITISNAIQNVQNTDTNFNIQASTMFISQFTKVWLGYTAQIGTNVNNEIMVNIYKDVGGQYVLYYQQFIPQGSQALQCGELAFIDADNLFIDCGYFNQTDNLIYNQFYIVSKNSPIVTLLDYTTQSISQITQLQIVLDADGKSVILLRGVYSSTLVGSLFIYSLDQYTLTLLNTITSLQMVDFESINFNCKNITQYLVYLLNQTQVMQMYSFNDFNTPSLTFNISQLLGNVQFYTFDIQFDEQSIFIYTNAFKQNLVQLNYNQILNYHNVRITDQLTSMAQLYNNDRIIALEVNNVIYFYSKREPFNLVSILNQNLISMNQSPFTILTYINSQIYFSYLTAPVAMGTFSQNTSLTITAKAQNEFGKATCTLKFNITILSSSTTLLQQKNYQLPLTAIANREATYLKIQNFASGPLINFNAKSNLSITFNNPSITYNQSLYIWQHIQGIESFYSKDYNSYSQIVIESNYIKGMLRNSALTLRICDIDLKSRIFQLENMDCTEYRNILSLSAPINKLQFTDLTKSNIVYAVMDLAKAAVIIYQLTDFSSLYQIKSKFICEPIPVDDYRYQHGIDDYTVIGSNLFLVLTKISQIWVYDVPTCTKQTAITNINLNYDFLPKYVLGTTNLQSNSLVGQLIFIGTQNEVMIVEIMNSLVCRLLNVIEFPENTINSAVKLVNDTLVIILITKYKQEIKTYKFYPEQPTIKPTYIKSLPLYGFLLTNPIVISSDLQYFYALMKDGYYNVYNPSLDYNDCLVYQLGHIGDYISPHYIPNLSKQSLIMLASTATIVTYSITNPQLIELQFYPTTNSLLHTEASYSIQFKSNVSTNTFTLNNSTVIYDTLVVGIWNQTQFQLQNNDNDQLSNSNGIININMDNVLQNNIVSYFITSNQNNFKNINPLNLNQITNFTNINVNQIISLNNGTLLVQNQEAIYYFTTDTLQMIYQFNNIFSQCNQLEYNGQDQLLSICSYYETYYFLIFNTSDMQQEPIRLTSKNTIYEPIKSQLINDTIVTLAIHTLSNYYQIQIFTFYSASIQYQMQIGCGLGLQGDVSDFQIIQGNNQFIIIYTCPYIQEVQMAEIIINANNTIQLSQQQTIKLKIELPKQAQFLELIPILINQYNPIFLLTTRQFYGVVIQMNFQQINQISSAILGYVAPMQQGILLKQTQYYNNTLYMVYQLDNTEILLASYNLTVNNIYNQQIIYSQDALNYKNLIVYAIMNPNNLICIYDKSQSFLIFNSQNQLQIEYSDLDEDDYSIELAVQQKYGQVQFILLNAVYSMKSKLQWWGWCLIVIGSIVLLVGIGITVKAIYDKNRKKEESERQLMIPNQMELNASIKI